MKKLFTLGLALVIALALVNCGSEKKTAIKPGQNDGQYFRAVGCATVRMSAMISMGQRNAFTNARQELATKISQALDQVAYCDFYGINLEEIIQNYTKELTLRCVTINEWREDDKYGITFYNEVETKKVDIRNAFISYMNKVSEEQNLGIDFSEERFVKYVSDALKITE